MVTERFKKRISTTRESINFSILNGITDIIVKTLTTGPLLTVYAIGIGMNNLHLGMLHSILPFSNLIHLVIAQILEKGASPRKVAWISSLAARPFLLLMALSVFLKDLSFGIYFFVIPYILTNICTSITGGAAWPWMKEFVPHRIMTTYFACRVQYIIIAKTLTFCIATAIITLIQMNKPALELYCYSMFYVLAFFAGLLCAYSLYRIKEVKLQKLTHIPFIKKVNIAFKNSAFIHLFSGIGLTNYASAFYTAFNIVFMLKVLNISTPYVLCFTLFTNIVEIIYSSKWKTLAHTQKPTYLLARASITYLLSAGILLGLSIYPVENIVYLTILLICTAALTGIGSSGFFITTNALTVAYVPNKMSSVYLSLINIGRFGLTGLGAVSSGFLLNCLTDNVHKWSIFFITCIVLYVVNAIICKKIKPIQHID